MTDTTGDMFQQAGERPPFGMITDSAEMPETGTNDRETIDENQLNLFED